MHSLLRYKYIFRTESQPSFNKLVDQSSDTDIELNKNDEDVPLEDKNGSQEALAKTKPLKVRFCFLTKLMDLCL